MICGNAFKYLARFRYKYKPVEDLEKAVWYLNDYVEHHQLAVPAVGVGYEITPTDLLNDEIFCSNAFAIINAENNRIVKNALTLIINFAIFGCSCMLSVSDVIADLSSNTTTICEDILREAREKEVINIAADLLSEDKHDISSAEHTAMQDIAKQQASKPVGIDALQLMNDQVLTSLSASDIDLINTDVEDDTTNNYHVLAANTVSDEDVVTIVRNSKTGQLYLPGEDVGDAETVTELVQIPREMEAMPYKAKIKYAMDYLKSIVQAEKPIEKPAKQRKKRTKKAK